MKGSNYIPKALLEETLVMEQISKLYHPNIVGYYGFKFVETLESAVDYLHSLGLAHNDINPDNIMIKDGMPVLIDFGSAQPFGKRLQSLGTEGWYEELFFTSEKKHDTYSLWKLREWLQNPDSKSRSLRDKNE
ncbi:hypothetical protein B7494_g5414 [Chlorociboria aeruginascens]|nr:hypothetical protein B7494_g5414 [Chlorociboria aeruginascens]